MSDDLDQLRERAERAEAIADDRTLEAERMRARADAAAADLDALRAEVSEAFGLAPGIGPAPGEAVRIVRKLRAEAERLRKELRAERDFRLDHRRLEEERDDLRGALNGIANHLRTWATASAAYAEQWAAPDGELMAYTRTDLHRCRAATMDEAATFAEALIRALAPVGAPEQPAVCPCEGDDEEPGPHLPTCPWADPDYEQPGDDGPHAPLPGDEQPAPTWHREHHGDGRWTDRQVVGEPVPGGGEGGSDA